MNTTPDLLTATRDPGANGTAPATGIDPLHLQGASRGAVYRRGLRARLRLSVSPRSLTGTLGLTGRNLAAAVAAVALLAGSLSGTAADQITRMFPDAPFGQGVITFDEFTIPKYDYSFCHAYGCLDTQVGLANENGVVFARDFISPDPSVGVKFAERFVGQTLSYGGSTSVSAPIHDVLSGGSSAPLTLQPGLDNQNLFLFDQPILKLVDVSPPGSDTSQYVPVFTGKWQRGIGGVGPLGFLNGVTGQPNIDAIGEGAFALLFPRDQSMISFNVLGSDGFGTFTIDFFRRDGGLIQRLNLDSNYTAPFNFLDPTGEIAGFSLYNADDAGLFFANFRYSTPGSFTDPQPTIGRWWDGGTGSVGNNIVEGGNGVWNGANINWTLRDGSSNNAWPQSGTAIFAGAAGGRVDVVDTQKFGGLTFLTGGYVLQGGNLQISPDSLVGPAPEGSLAPIFVDPGLTAGIDSALTDAGGKYGLAKTGLGALTLTGNNSYTAGTSLLQGVLGVGRNTALGTGALTMADGTTLRAAAPDLVLANPVTLGAVVDATIDTQDYWLTLTGRIESLSRPPEYYEEFPDSSKSTLIKTGEGRLILTGNNDIGAVDVRAGALENRGTLYNPNDTFALSGNNTALLNATGGTLYISNADRLWNSQAENFGVAKGGDGAQRVDNAGAIQAGVDLGPGNDQYILRATGSQIFREAETRTFTYSWGEVYTFEVDRRNVDGGDGLDALQLETGAGATRTLNPGAFVNFETIDLNKEIANTGKFVIAGGAGPTPGFALDAGASGGSLTLHRGEMQLPDAASAVRAATTTIAQDAVLSGVGTVYAGTGAGEGLIVNGAISPGNNSIGAINVVGNYIQNGAYNLEFRAPAPGVAPVAGVDNDLINVVGVATLNDGAALRLFPLSTAADYRAALTAANNPTPGKLRYTVIQTTGGMNAGRISLLGFSGATTEKDDKNLYLVLNDAGENGGNGGRSGLVVNRAPAQLATVLTQDAQFGCRGSLLGRNTIGYNEVRREEGCVWADGYAQLGGVKSVRGGGGGADPWGVAGAKYTTGGFAFGGDRALEPHIFAGGSFTYGNTSAHFSDTVGSQALNGFHGALYGAFDDGVWNAGFSAGYSHYTVNATRNTQLETNPTAQAHYDMRQVRLGAVARRILALSDTWWVLPEARFNWEPLTRDAFAETQGGDANFHSAAAQWNIARAGLGVILRHKPDWLPAWTAEIELGWRRLLGDTAMPLRGFYQGAPDALYQTPANAWLRDSVSVRGAITNRVSDTLSVVANYAGQFNAQRYDNLFNLMLRQQF